MRTARCVGRSMELPCSLQASYPPQISVCSATQKLSEPWTLFFYGGLITQKWWTKWLTSVIGLHLQLLSLSPEVGGLRTENSNPLITWLIFLLAILIPVYASSSLAFCMMYSTYKLNEQGDNLQPWCTSFPIWNQSVVPCAVLTVASWPAYRFLRRQSLGEISITLDTQMTSSLWQKVKRN